jgi:hypothetical protein
MARSKGAAMPDIPSTEPRYIRAGETVKWSKSLPEFLATEYTLKYYLTGPASVTLTATAYNTIDHLVTILPTASAVLVYGLYTWESYAEKGTGETLEKYFVSSGQVLVKTAAGKSHIKKTLDALEALIEGRATDGMDNFSLGGKSVSRMDAAELLKWHSKYTILYRDELAAEKVAQGFPDSRRVGVRFRRL